MAAANLVRLGESPLTLYLIDENHDALGVAYGTTNPEHLLNVRASNMSAFADQPEHFVQWLGGSEAAAKKAAFGLEKKYEAGDFVPRMLYGDYLQSIWQETQQRAAAKNIQLKLVPTRAVAVQGGSEGTEIAIFTERGDAIAIDNIILALGHETKAIFPEIRQAAMLQNPWGTGAFDGAANWSSPVLLIGTGLTAIDVMLSLRRAGYAGEIVMASRRGMMPQMHAVPTAICSFTAEEISNAKTLSTMLKMLRTKIAACGDWRAAIDALRPHTQTLWQRLTSREQQRFLTQLLPIWNVHRHRCAPEIAAAMHEEIMRSKTRLVSGKKIAVREEAGQLYVALGKEKIAPSRIINCTGFELNLARSSNLLLRQLLATGMVEAHATGQGIAADKYGRAWGNAYPQLYAIGSLLTGQLLESTAVPELRQQAQQVAHTILNGE